MLFRFLIKLIIFFVTGVNSTKAQEVRSIEIGEYPELKEIMSDMAPVSSVAPFVSKIKLATGDPRLIVITQRGHGQSDKPVSGYHPEDFAADLDAFMTAQNLDKAIIVGHSLGSTIAQSFALQYPSRVSGLVLLGTIPYFKTNPALMEFGSQVALLKDPIDHAFASDFQKSTLRLPIPETYLDSVINETLKVPSLVWKAVMNGLSEVYYSKRLKNINAPVLIIFGDKDNFSSLKDQEQFRSSIRGSRLLVYNGVGHAIHWEKPGQTAVDISSFIKNIDKNTIQH
jgi:non-heme chloroperoxidase